MWCGTHSSLTPFSVFYSLTPLFRSILFNSIHFIILFSSASLLNHHSQRHHHHYFSQLLAIFASYFPARGSVDEYTNNPALFQSCLGRAGSLMTDAALNARLRTLRTPKAGDVKYIFSTRPGSGPQKQPIEEALLSPSTALPASLSSRIC